MTRPIEALIHSAALQHNYHLVKNLAPQAFVWAVIKANAYGHGLQRVVKALPDAEGFAILEIEQAISLREAGEKRPILLLEGVFSADEVALCSRYNFSLAVHEPRQLEWLEVADLPDRVHVALKLNTGMNRLGFIAEDAERWAARLKACRNVASLTLMMHFATADEPAKGIDAQWSRFTAVNEKLGLPVCAANSAAIFAYPQTHGAAIRPGIVLYGSSPFADRSAKDLGLQAAMTLKSKIIGVQALQAGDAVGYGATFRTETPMRIGVVACGYGDGYPRHAPTGAPVWVAGQRTRLVGRISMDMLTVDLTGIAGDIGSEVELWGQNLPIDEVAAAAGTISYELMCALALRVPVTLL